jgi:hypothetical protein
LTTLSQQAASAEKQLKTAPAGTQVLTPTLVHGMLQAMQAGRQSVHTLLALLDEEKPSTDAKSAPPAPTIDLETVRSTLQTMATQLRASDMQALETMAQLQAQWPSAPAEGLENLQQAVASLDFEAALAACETLATSV